MALPDLSRSDVEQIFVFSEGRSNPARRNAKDGHSIARHNELTRAGLYDRATGTRNGQIAMFSAFISKADQVDAALETINCELGRWARQQMFQAQRSHDGMEAVIRYSGRERMVRYSGGTGTMPQSVYKMVLQRADGFPCRLFILTFYSTMSGMDTGPRVSVTTAGDQPFSAMP